MSDYNGLKPCPFCGGIAFIQKRKKYKDFPYRVKCSNTTCCNRTGNWNEVSGAIKAWNRRVDE